MKENLKIFNIVINMGNELDNLISFTKDIENERFAGIREELKSNIITYNIIADKYMENSAKVSMQEVWDKFELLLASFGRYISERYLLHITKVAYITCEEEEKLNNIVDNLEFLTEDED